MLDAEVREYLVSRRLPEDVSYSAQVTIASRTADADDPTPFLACLAAGYKWGESVDMFAMLSTANREAVEAIAARYDGRVEDLGALLADATIAVSQARMVFHDEPPEATIDDAYESVGATTLDLLGFGGDRDSNTLRGAFHLGAAMFAAETTLADALLFRERVAHVERAQRRDRILRALRLRR